MIRLISNERGDTPLVEAYRTLRSNLQYVCNQQKSKIICITAATSGEGTSEVAANTAIALSKNNNKVLLVDGNLRNPVQHVAFNVQNKGLTNAVIMDEDLTIHRNIVPHLDVLTAGEIVEHPSDVVDSSKLSTIWDYIRDEYDVVIIDTPPVLDVTDAIVLAEKSDGVMLVVKNEVASPKDLIEAKNELIKRSMDRLKNYLKNNPILFDGEYYNCTLEKQNILYNKIKLHELKKQQGINDKILWNSTGDKYIEWEYENILKLAYAIQSYIDELVKKQQEEEIKINNCLTLDELIKYQQEII